MLLENQKILEFSQAFPRSVRQINGCFESDAELVEITDHQILAFTTDTMVEEIESGLYDDPYQMGWMAVTANLSDLAAVGADPIGINIMLNLPIGPEPGLTKSIQKGVADACREYGIWVLGGDTNSSQVLQVGGAALGVIDEGNPIMRTGAQPGDHLFVSAPLGYGGFYALTKLFGCSPSIDFFPKARVREGKIVRQFGSCCIDTSDGFFPALSNLAETNSVGFQLDLELDAVVAPDFRSKLIKEDIPPWIVLAGPHGEFELLFTIPETRLAAFKRACETLVWKPIPIGRVSASPGLTFPHRGSRRTVNPDDISNLFNRSGGDVRIYLKELHKINRSWQQ